jgi:hypothetical protein
LKFSDHACAPINRLGGMDQEIQLVPENSFVKDELALARARAFLFRGGTAIIGHFLET